ncbi:MAG: cell wall-binding repeat-containing protein [Bacillota bacterium]|nr:cell wall-binding repeat-containing protein [Bacillota bacterium]
MHIERRLKHTRRWFWVITTFIIVLAMLLLFYYRDYYKAEPNGIPVPIDQSLAAKRLPGKDAIKVAIAVSQNIYPATFADNKPGAVILVPKDDWMAAVLATEIIHFPINAPILYIDNNNIPRETLDEIKRLDPEGLFLDGNIKVILLTEPDGSIERQLKEEKLKFRVLSAETPEKLASLLDDYKAMFHVDHDDEVIIMPKDPTYAVIATSWVAHMGHSLFYVGDDGLSASLRNSLAKRPQDAFIYVLGDEKTIPPEVTEELAVYGHVQRIPGGDPFEMSTGFAAYLDFGPNFGWWIRRTTRQFGWAVGEAGHNFTFINPDFPLYVPPAAALSHKGKHGPILLVNQDTVTASVSRYLRSVQPTFLSSQEQLFNHGWIIGDNNAISSSVQAEVDRLLQVKLR